VLYLHDKQQVKQAPFPVDGAHHLKPLWSDSGSGLR
jgi:hypothetical protein